MLEEILFVTLRLVLGLILWIVVEFLFYIIFYYIGLPICLLFTLGRYPPHTVWQKINN